MNRIAEMRTILEAIKGLTPYFNEQEISELATVIYKATVRMENENEEK